MLVPNGRVSTSEPSITFLNCVNFCLLLAACGCFTAFVASAQRPAQDYVVTTAGDTLRGRITVSFKGAGRVTLRQPGQPRARFSPAEARSYGDAVGVMGQSQAVGPRKTQQFMAPLVQGPVSLYGGYNANGAKRYFLQVPDTAYLVEIVPATAQLTFHQKLAGCSSLEFGSTAMHSRYPTNYAGLTRLVMQYNACTKPQQPSTLVKSPATVRIVRGLKAGVNVSGFALSYYAFPTPKTRSVGYQGGLFLRATNKTPFSIQVEALLSTLRSTYGQPSSARTVEVDYKQVQFPLLLRYTLGLGTVRPFVNAGALIGLNFDNKSMDSYRSSSSPPRQDPITTLGTYGIGASAGIGATIRRTGLPELGVELRFDRMRYGNYVFFTPRHNSLRLDVSVGF